MGPRHRRPAPVRQHLAGKTEVDGQLLRVEVSKKVVTTKEQKCIYPKGRLSPGITKFCDRSHGKPGFDDPTLRVRGMEHGGIRPRLVLPNLVCPVRRSSMNFPVWDVAFGAGLLIALVAIPHVFVSHYAVGDGLFLVLTERKARRNNDAALLNWLKSRGL
jgi:hypothetical protein